MFSTVTGEMVQVLCSDAFSYLVFISLLISYCLFSQQLIDQYFSQIEKIINEKKISPRVKFMLKDVEDLRKVRSNLNAGNQLYGVKNT